MTGQIENPDPKGTDVDGEVQGASRPDAPPKAAPDPESTQARRLDAAMFDELMGLHFGGGSGRREPGDAARDAPVPGVAREPERVAASNSGSSLPTPLPGRPGGASPEADASGAVVNARERAATPLQRSPPPGARTTRRPDDFYGAVKEFENLTAERRNPRRDGAQSILGTRRSGEIEARTMRSTGGEERFDPSEPERPASAIRAAPAPARKKTGESLSRVEPAPRRGSEGSSAAAGNAGPSSARWPRVAALRGLLSGHGRIFRVCGAYAGVPALIGCLWLALAPRNDDARVLTMLGDLGDKLADAGRLATPEDVAAIRVAVAELKSSVDDLRVSAGAMTAELRSRIETVERARAVTIEPAASAERNRPPKATGARPAPGGGALSESFSLATPVYISSARPPSIIGSSPTRGYIVREVYYNGTAVIENAAGRQRVAVGDFLPGVGKVEAIEPRGKQWVVVTEKGPIN